MALSEEKKAYLREYYRRNRERLVAMNKEWCERNPERRKEIANKWARENAEHRRRHKLKSRYGLTGEQYDEMRAAQDYRCAICREHESKVFRGRLVVDHCHSTGRVRKLLCANCNSSLGHTKENAETARALVEYIETVCATVN